MKSIKTNLLTLVFSFLSIAFVYGQAVDAVVLVGGVANNVTKTKTICILKDSVRLEASNCGTCTAGSNVTIKWTQTFSPFTVFNSSFVYAKKSGWWRVTVTNNSNPTEVDKDSVYIDYYAYPSFNIVIPDPNKCYLNVSPPFDINYDTASTTFSGTLPISNYQWYYLRFVDNQIFTLPGSTKDTLVYTKTAGYYIVLATDGNGCTIGDTSVYINEITPLDADLGPDPTSSYCEGTTYSLQSTVATGGNNVTYYYKQGATVLFTNSPGTIGNVPCPSYMVTLNTPGVVAYNVFLANNLQCPGYDTINVTVNPLPTFSYPATSVLCYGTTTLQLTPTITNGAPISSWTWNGTPAALSHLSATNIPNPIVSGITGNTPYTVTASNACGNRTTPTFSVTYNPPINLSASATGFASSSVADTIICSIPVGTAKLSSNATGGSSGFTYSWDPAAYGLATPTNKNTNANPVVDTSYTVTATDAGGCNATKTVKVKLQKPTLSVSTSSSNVPPKVNEEGPITVTATSSAPTFIWKAWKRDSTVIDSLVSNASTFQSRYLDRDKTIYYYVTAQDAKGCLNRDSLSLAYISKNIVLYVPNIFSPYAEKTENQKLKVFGDNLSPENFKMIVYNKWGKQVWEADLNAAKEGWDGSSYEQGVYTYYISGKFKNDLPVTESPYYKGNFTLLK